MSLVSQHDGRVWLKLPVGRVGQAFRTIFGDHQVVFDAYPAEAVDVDPRLVGNDGADFEAVVLVVEWIVGNQSEAVSEPVCEILTEACFVDVIASDFIEVSNIMPGFKALRAALFAASTTS